MRGIWGRKEGREREKPLSHHMETNFVINKCEVFSVVSVWGLVETARDAAVTLSCSTKESVKIEQTLQ